MDFFEVIRRRRSIRRFTGEAVKEDDILAMLEAARLAPSATNEQPWRFIVIRDKEIKKQMQDMVNAMIDMRIESEEDEVRRKRIEQMRFYSNYFGDAPVVIAVLTRPWPAAFPGFQGQQRFDSGLQSVAAAIAHLHLAATALGYGSCWATSPVDFAGEELEIILGVEEPWSLVALISVGVAARIPSLPPRKSLAEIATFIG